MSHYERAKIAMRTLFFLRTWRKFLAKAGYSESRHFISKEAMDICEILANGILSLILIHRDHLSSEPRPLLPWSHGSEPNEHTFADMRGVCPDFTLGEAVVMVPKMRTLMEASCHVRMSQTKYKKQASGYQHTYFSFDDVNFELLSQYPTDDGLSNAYLIGFEENESLWTLLGIHPVQIDNAPSPALSITLDAVNDADFNDIHNDDFDLETEPADRTDAEELQEIIDNIGQLAGLSTRADSELDACAFAAVAISLDELAAM